MICRHAVVIVHNEQDNRQCAIDPMEIRLLPQDVILRAVLGNNRSISSSPTSAPAGVSVWCCWPIIYRLKHHNVQNIIEPHIVS